MSEDPQRLPLYLRELNAAPLGAWQWLPTEQCFEIGSAPARPRLAFGLDDAVGPIVLTVRLSADDRIIGSDAVELGKEPVSDIDDLLSRLQGQGKPSTIILLLVRLLRGRQTMAHERLPERPWRRLGVRLGVGWRRLTHDVPFNVRSRVASWKLKRQARRTRPRK